MFCTCRAHYFAGRLIISERAVHVIVSIVDRIPACYAITVRRVWVQDSIDRLAPVSCAFLFNHHNVCTPLVRCLFSQFFLLLLPATVLMVQDFKDDDHDAGSNSSSNHYKHTWKIRNEKKLRANCIRYLNAFSTCISSIKHLVQPLKKNSITLVFNFSLVLKSSQDNASGEVYKSNKVHYGRWRKWRIQPLICFWYLRPKVTLKHALQYWSR